jgi:hypothetical protein
MSRMLLASGFIAGVAALAMPAAAETPSACAQPEKIADLLHKDYLEKPVAFGVQGDGSLMQVFASREGNTWTVVMTTPRGVSCIVAEGTRWEALPRQPDGPVA